MIKFVFFLIFYVLLGTTGVTIPLLLSDEFMPNEVSIGLVTIIMSTVGYNASERIMQLYDEKANKKVENFINLVALVIALMITIYVCIRVTKPSTIYIAAVFYFISCVFWWFQNWNNKHLENTHSATTLGGDIEQFNK